MPYPLFELVPLVRVRTEGQQAAGVDDKQNTKWPSVRLCTQKQHGKMCTTLLVCNNDYILIRREEWDKETITKQLQWYQNPQRAIQAIVLDPTGTWAVAVCRDTSIHIIPIGTVLAPHKAQLTQLWNTEDLTEITLTAKRGVPKVVEWWKSSDGKRVAIIGTQAGEIIFVDLTLLRDVRTVCIKDEEISALEVVYHDVTAMSFLLIHTKSGNQWGLLLEHRMAYVKRHMSEGETAASMGYEIIEPDSVPRNSILHAGDDSTGYTPVRFQQFVNEVILSPQVCLGHTFVSAHERSSCIFKVFDSSIDNWLPLHVYRLPTTTLHVILTDRLMFTISKDDNKSTLNVLSNHLSETASQDQPANEDALTQVFDLPAGEEIIGLYKKAFPKKHHSSAITSTESGHPSADNRDDGDTEDNSREESSVGSISMEEKCGAGARSRSDVPQDLLAKIETHSVLDGCVLITDAAIYQCKPRCSPEGLFLELALADDNTTPADNLGITLGLDVNYLYEIVAIQKLKEGHCQQAMKLFHRSECPYLKQAKLFLEQRCIREVLALVSIALCRPLELAAGDRRDIADIAINCYVQEVMQGQAEQEFMDSFRQFLKDNFDYNEVKALELFAECGMYDILFEVARARGLVSHALNVVLSIGSPELPGDIQTSLISQGFISSIAGAADSAVIRCMTSHDTIDFLLKKPELAFRYMEMMSRCLEDLEPRTLLKLAWLFDPSKDAIKPLLCKVSSAYAKMRSRTMSSGSLFSVDSYSSDNLDPNQVYPKPASLVEFFLKILVILNHKKESNEGKQSLDIDLHGLDWCTSGHAGSAEGQGVRSSSLLAQQRRIVDCGQNHVGVVAAGGDVFTWGRAHNGRLGHGDIIPADGKAAPFRVETLHMHRIRVVSVACGKEHTVALGDQGKVYAWGSSQYGQLGCGDYNTRTRPVLVEGLIGRSCAAIACGQFHTLALTQDQKVYSWGWGVHGQLGHGNINDQLHPRHIPCLDQHKVTKISAGYCHSGTLTSEGQLYMFGSSAFGQLGSGNNDKSAVPLLVEGISKERVVTFSCGFFHNVAVTSSPQTVYSWGRSPLELRQALQSSRKRRSGRDAGGGGGSREFHGRGRSTTFVGILPGDDKMYLSPSVMDCNVHSAIEQIICSCNHSMILTVSGELHSWGRGDCGQLGHSNRSDNRCPTLIASSTNNPIAAASAGIEFSIGVTYQGQVMAWGSPEFGQLGMDRGITSSKNSLYANPRMRKMGHPNMTSRPVLSPTTVTGLPQISMTSDLDIEDDSDEEESGNHDNKTATNSVAEVPFDWSLPDLAQPDPVTSAPYSNTSIQLALCSLDSHYNHPNVLQLCVDHKNWSASADICELDGDYTQALDYRLRGFAAKIQDDKEGSAKEAVLLISKYIKLTQERFPDSENDLQKAIRLIIIQVLNYWSQHSLPQDILEDLLRQHLNLMAYPLSLLIYSKPSHQMPPHTQSTSSANDTNLVPQDICDKFTSQLCLDVTQAVMQHITEGKPHEEYIDILKQSTATNPETTTQMGLGSSPPEGGILLNSQPDSSVAEEKLWEEILHNLRKDIHSRAYISLSASEVANLVESDMDGENINATTSTATEQRKDCVVFTCGHHYDRRTFQNTTMPQWLGIMGKLPVPLPTSAEVFTTQYSKGEGFLPMACPRCVYSRLHQEQLKQETAKQN